MGWFGSEGALLSVPTRVLVLGVDGPESLMAAAPIALGLEAAGHAVTIGAEPSNWADATAEWYREQARPVNVVSWDGSASSLAAHPRELTLAVAGASILRPTGAVRAQLEVVRAGGRAAGIALGLGAEAALGADPADARARLAELGAIGAVLDTQAVLRFSTAGRHFVELVEHVHHRVGPEAQSVIADSLRAALFGRHGSVAVSLATRERPVALDPLTTIAWLLDLEELLRAPE